MNDQQAPQPTQQVTAQQWAIVELFGHSRIAGAVSEQSFGGSTFVRIDVPELHTTSREFDRASEQWVDKPRSIQQHTRSFGSGAIYSINWCDEPTARAAAAAIRHEPISTYTLREAFANLPAAERTRLLGAPETAVDADPF